MGAMVSNTKKWKSIDDPRTLQNDESEWIVVPDCHEAIVTGEEYEKARGHGVQGESDEVGGVGMKYFNNNKQRFVKNRRDADKLIESSHKVAMLLSLTILHDKFGFGKKRIDRFLHEYKELLDSYERGYITPDDLNGVLWEEVGMKVL